MATVTDRGSLMERLKRARKVTLLADAIDAEFRKGQRMGLIPADSLLSDMVARWEPWQWQAAMNEVNKTANPQIWFPSWDKTQVDVLKSLRDREGESDPFDGIGGN